MTATPRGEVPSLRGLLGKPRAYEEIAARAAAGSLPGFAVTLFDHVGDVYRRVEIAAGADHPAIVAMRLAALVHEEPPAALPSILAAAGMTDLAPTVQAVVAQFGRVWKLANDADQRDFVAINRRHLAEILLFEVAHEGRATPEMERAAAIAGLGDALQSWNERLAAARG